MERDEITSVLAVGAPRELCVLLDRPSDIPGYVRSITIHPRNRVQIAYEVEGMDEGGAYFWATYPSLDAALTALEEFLGIPTRDWKRPHLEERTSERPATAHDALAAAIRARSLRFPKGAEFELKDSYWRQFLTDE